MKIGVLALQGDFAAHCRVVSHLGYEPLEVRTAAQIKGLTGLILPGGESSTMLKLLDVELEKTIVETAHQGLGIFGTCAGLILLAEKVSNPDQRSLRLLPVSIERNSYGRQIDSFLTQDILLENSAKKGLGLERTSGIFIRAPKIVDIAPEVESLASLRGNTVMVRFDKIFGCSFHPELGDSGNFDLHRFIISTWASRH